MISANIVNDHLCPECGHKIGLHTNSPFGHNPSSDNTGIECRKTYNDLLIEKLTAWWNDAISERDAYIKSYKKVCEDNFLIRKKLDFLIGELGKLAYGLTPAGWMSSKAQEILYQLRDLEKDEKRES